LTHHIRVTILTVVGCVGYDVLWYYVVVSRKRSAAKVRTAPLPVIDGLRVLKFALIRRPIEFSGDIGLVVSSEGQSKEVGAVPRLAIGQSLRGQREFFLLHCTRIWQVIATQSGFHTSAQAERRAECIYPGVSSAWVDTKVSLARARQIERAMWASLACNFCGRIPPEFDIPGEGLLSARGANICNKCISQRFQEITEAT
jgi:hypothetical protein